MVVVLSAECACGLRGEWLHTGSGWGEMERVDLHPASCSHCGLISMTDLSDDVTPSPGVGGG